MKLSAKQLCSHQYQGNILVNGVNTLYLVKGQVENVNCNVSM